MSNDNILTFSGIVMLLGWSIYVFLIAFSTIEMSLPPEFYTIFKHIGFVIVALILVFVGLRR